METSLRDISIGILITIIIILLYIIVTAHNMDKRNRERSDIILMSLPQHPTNGGQDVAKIAKQTMTAYKLRKSRKTKILKSCRDGIFRGILGGVVTGSGLSGIVGGAIIWGSVTGLLSGLPLIEQQLKGTDLEFE